MIKYITIVALILCGCQTMVQKEKIVYVDKPIPYCPAPPDVPPCPNYRSLLTLDDLKDPGKVAVAYNIDVVCYDTNDKTFRDILSKYKTISNNNSNVQMTLTPLQVQQDKPKN